MISFKEYLTEARMAPLYHATSLSKAAMILDKRGFEGRTLQKINKTDSNYQNGLSTTRDYKFAIRWGLNQYENFVIFHLDRNKIRNNYKLLPYNYWWHVTRDKLNNESEEFVILNDGRLLPISVVNQIDYYAPKQLDTIKSLSIKYPNIKFKSIVDKK